jgi:hypothetical protein
MIPSNVCAGRVAGRGETRGAESKTKKAKSRAPPKSEESVMECRKYMRRRMSK